MTWEQRTEAQRHEARRELEAAQQGLASNTEAARVRYARALCEADIAERQVERMARDHRRHQQSWRLSAG
jgi:hypothetical protein